MNKQELITVLIRYDFDKVEQDPKTKQGVNVRPMGFGNSIANLEVTVKLITELKECGYDKKQEKEMIPELIDQMYRCYDFVNTCYTSINFKELEGNKDEPAVVMLYQVKEKLDELGKGIYEFTYQVTRMLNAEGEITKQIRGYTAIIKTLEEIRTLDKNSFYRKEKMEVYSFCQFELQAGVSAPLQNFQTYL